MILERAEIEQCLVDIVGSENQAELAAYYLSREPLPEYDLLAHCADRLAMPMVPRRFVHLNSFPSTLNGKIDRSALPKPDPSRLEDRDAESQSPSTATELALAGIWRRYLGIDDIRLGNDFFSLGGTSLLAMEASAAIAREFDLPIRVQELFKHPTIANLASYVEECLLESIEDLSEEEAAQLLAEEEGRP